MNRNAKLLRSFVEHSACFRLPVGQRRQICGLASGYSLRCSAKHILAARDDIVCSVHTITSKFATQANTGRKMSGGLEQNKFKDHLIVPDILSEPPGEICDVCVVRF